MLGRELAAAGLVVVSGLARGWTRRPTAGRSTRAGRPSPSSAAGSIATTRRGTPSSPGGSPRGARRLRVSARNRARALEVPGAERIIGALALATIVVEAASAPARSSRPTSRSRLGRRSSPCGRNHGCTVGVDEPPHRPGRGPAPRRRGRSRRARARSRGRRFRACPRGRRRCSPSSRMGRPEPTSSCARPGGAARGAGRARRARAARSRRRSGGHVPCAGHYDRGLSVPLWLDGPAAEYGPLPGDERVEIAIVGAGVTGLACARVLASEGRRVRVLEARRAGSGASGRNGGFALRGLAAPYDIARSPDLMRFTEEALERLRALASDLFRPVGSLRVAVTDDELDSPQPNTRPLPRTASPSSGETATPCPGDPAARSRWDLPPARRLAGPGRLASASSPPSPTRPALRSPRRRASHALDGTRVETDQGTVEADAIVVATNGYSRGSSPSWTRRSPLRVARCSRPSPSGAADPVSHLRSLGV